MGYYTYHTLEVEENPHTDIDHENEISELADYRDLFGGETVKWYEHERDMRIYSKKHPNTLFILRGEGEESGDIWLEYHKNGLMQRCRAKLVFDDYNEGELK